jgi:histidinol dehydrogenase
VQTFLRGIHIVEYDKAALAEAMPFVIALSTAEDLPGHGDAVKIRFAGE